MVFNVQLYTWMSLLIAATLPRDVTTQDCAAGVDDCVNKAFGIIGANPDDRELICKTTDEFLVCIVKETKACDVVVTASIKEGVSPMIDMYTSPPYSCVLENADDEAVRADPCSQQMNRCAVFYTQADTEPDPSRACDMFEQYLGCMTIDTSQCSADLVAYLQEHSVNATIRFDSPPYYCEERLNFDIDAVDTSMPECYDAMSQMNLNIMKQDYICGVYQEFYNCTSTTLRKASPRQFDMYAEKVDRDAASFRTIPFFCDDADPCMSLFKSCNASAYSPIITPCELMDVYTSCLTRSLSSCAEDNYARLAETVLTLRGEIHNTYNCIEANKHIPFGEDADDKNDAKKNSNPSNDGSGGGKGGTSGSMGGATNSGTPTNTGQSNNGDSQRSSGTSGTGKNMGSGQTSSTGGGDGSGSNDDSSSDQTSSTGNNNSDQSAPEATSQNEENGASTPLPAPLALVLPMVLLFSWP